MLTIGITINYSEEIKESVFFLNGYNQNVKFFFDLMQGLGHECFFIVNENIEQERIKILNKSYLAYSRSEITRSKRKVDIVFEAGTSVTKEDRFRFKKNNHSRIVCLRYGHDMIMAMEQICHGQTLTPGIHIGCPDAVWISPHFEQAKTYLEVLYNSRVKIAPFIWEPDFVKSINKNNFGSRLSSPDIFVMEPNISVLKNCLIPMAIIEKLYRENKDLFGKATILNGISFNDKEYFLDNVVRNFHSLISESNKVYFTGRYRIHDVFMKRDILLSHQIYCPLNYLYFESLYLGIPLVHNSKVLQGCGYYYPECDVHAGYLKCLEAISDLDIIKYKNNSLRFLKKFSIENMGVRKIYANLIDDILK